MSIKWISVKEEPPKGEVLALGFQDEILLGYVEKDGNEYICESEGEMLSNVTHYITKEDLLKLEKGEGK